jgi:hypothetical protein
MGAAGGTSNEEARAGIASVCARILYNPNHRLLRIREYNVLIVLWGQTVVEENMTRSLPCVIMARHPRSSESGTPGRVITQSLTVTFWLSSENPGVFNSEMLSRLCLLIEARVSSISLE